MKRDRSCNGFSQDYSCKNRPLPGEDLCSFCKSRKFELAVCDVLKELGATATQNIAVEGSQCDILAEFEGKLGRTTYYVECKGEREPIGVATINEFYNAFQTARHARHYDKAMLVSAHGFTADAKAKAESVGIIYHTLDELREKRADFRPYLRAMIPEYEESPFCLRKYYIPLSARLEGCSESRPLHELLDDFRDNRVPGPLLIILGDFGTGKTTALRRFFWSQSKAYLLQPATTRIPIFVNLRDFHLTMDLNKTLIGMLIDEYGLKLEGLHVFRQLNREGRLIILLDAFDEMIAKVGPEYITFAFRQFEKVVYPSSKVVLTVRTHFLRDADHLAAVARSSELQEYARGKNYPIVYIEPLTTAQIEEYINNGSFRPECG